MKIGLLTNPNSKKNKKGKQLTINLEEILSNGLYATPINGDEKEYYLCIKHLLDAGTECIAVNGGDGTVHRALTALKALSEEVPVLPLGSGTFNVYPTSLGMAGGLFGMKPEKILIKAVNGEGLVPVKRKILCIYDGFPLRYGYSFASGICERFMQVYEDGGEYGRLRFIKEAFKTICALMLNKICTPAREYYGKITCERKLDVVIDKQSIPLEIWSTILAVSMELKFDFKLFKATAYKGLNEMEDKIAFLGGEANIWRGLANAHKGLLKMEWNVKNFYDMYAREILIRKARHMNYIIDGEQYTSREDEIAIFPSSALFLKV
ncbi:hypothetical protein HZB88_02370 [archaeon]|nr:hypothetical protein [archaeon]